MRFFAPIACLLFALSACSTPALSPTASSGPSASGGTFTPSEQPSATAEHPSLPPSAPPTRTPDPTATPVAGTTYTVQRGDTLSAIARSFGTTAEQIRTWNADRYPSLAADPNV
ncbi:MAG: LysM peptidoglycan-binding domain-containing protein, partial [Candidatus Limnocylindria bacterium]